MRLRRAEALLTCCRGFFTATLGAEAIPASRRSWIDTPCRSQLTAPNPSLSIPLLAHTLNPRAGSCSMDRLPHQPSAGVIAVPSQPPPSEPSGPGPQGPSAGGDSGIAGPLADLEWRALAWNRFGKVNQVVSALEI